MALPVRPLGSSGLAITTVGFGAWAIGGGGWSHGWGPQDDATSIAAMRRALALGVNWIDTAAVYGLGHSEEVVGRLLRDLPLGERPLVFTKGGLVWDERDRMQEARRVLRPDSIRRECEASLRRLGIERIDLYQFHRPDETGTPIAESWGAMVRLVEEGKVRAAGVSNFDVALLERCEAIRHVDSLQPPFSLIRRDVAARELAWCAVHRTGVIVYSPMQTGLLTDSFTAARVRALPADDWRRNGTSRGGTRCGRSAAVMGRACPRSPWRGRSPGPASPAPSWGRALRHRWMAGSGRLRSGSTRRTSTKSPPRSSGRRLARAPSARRHPARGRHAHRAAPGPSRPTLPAPRAPTGGPRPGSAARPDARAATPNRALPRPAPRRSRSRRR
jgi:aryl-alcohol dehydrogenase-like predicted oxidoreductase